MITKEEGNKFIVEYMGAKWWKKNRSLFVKYSEAYEFNYNGKSIAFRIKGLKYHLSWAWLMPVVEKIMKELQYESIIDTLSYILTKYMTNVYRERKGEFISMKNIEEVWVAVVEFIKWQKQLGLIG